MGINLVLNEKPNTSSHKALSEHSNLEFPNIFFFSKSDFWNFLNLDFVDITR